MTKTIEQQVEEVKKTMAKGRDNERCIGTGTHINPLDEKIITQALQERDRIAKEECVELAAKAIYTQMECLDPRGKPDWVEGGNSLKQDEARKLARKALTIQSENKK